MKIDIVYLAIVASPLLLALPGPVNAAEASLSPSPTTSTSTLEIAIPASTGKPPLLSLKAAVKTRRITDKNLQATISGAELETDLKHTFGKVVSSHLNFLTLLQAGSTNSMFSDEGKATNGFSINEAAMVFKAMPELAFKGGLIETRPSSMPTFFFRRGFPGLSETVTTSRGRFRGSLTAAQLVPTASGFSRDRSSETGPSLLLHTATAQVGEENDRLSATVSAMHFRFDNLNANNAQESRFIGNTVEGLGAAQARFTYDYEGAQGTLTLRARLNRVFSAELNGSTIRNFAAPSGAAAGWLATFVPTIDLPAVALKPELGYYRAESDILPALYTESAYGQTNRGGAIAGLKVELKDEHVTLTSRWIQARKLTENPYLADRSIFTVGIEGKYELL